MIFTIQRKIKMFRLKKDIKFNIRFIFLTKGYCRFYIKPLIIWFANGFTFSDIVFDNIPKVLSLPIALST